MSRTVNLLVAGALVVTGAIAGVIWRDRATRRRPVDEAADVSSPPPVDSRAGARPMGAAPVRPPRSPPAAPAATVAPPPAPPGAGPAETELMARLRVLARTDPGAAISLAREGERRFPDGADAPERSSILIHALVAQGQAAPARGEAERMVNHYPDSDWVREVEQFTGAHRHRDLRVTDAGEIEYQ